MARGAGELAVAGLGTALGVSTSMALPLLLLSLLVARFSLFSLLLLSAEGAAAVESSDGTSSLGLDGAVHRGISHTTPVKLFI